MNYTAGNQVRIGQIWEYVGEKIHYPNSGVRLHNLNEGDRIIVEGIEQFDQETQALFNQGRCRPSHILCNHFGYIYRLFADTLVDDFKLIDQSASRSCRPGACKSGGEGDLAAHRGNS